MSNAPAAEWQTETLGVTFFDLSHFADWSGSTDDLRIAELLQAFYAECGAVLQTAGLRIVKFMGDAGLAVFSPEQAPQAIDALADLAVKSRELLATHGLDAWLNINVHVGPVVTGLFGVPGEERYDVLGKTVNVAARLGRRGLTLSPQAYRCLGGEHRERFQKHQPPVTYHYQF